MELRKIQPWAITHTLNRVQFDQLKERLIPDKFLLDENTQRHEEEKGNQPNKMSIAHFLLNKDDKQINKITNLRGIPALNEESAASSSTVNTLSSRSQHVGLINIAPLSQPPAHARLFGTGAACDSDAIKDVLYKSLIRRGRRIGLSFFTQKTWIVLDNF